MLVAIRIIKQIANDDYKDDGDDDDNNSADVGDKTDDDSMDCPSS